MTVEMEKFLAYMNGESDEKPPIYFRRSGAQRVVKAICDLISLDHVNANGTTYEFGHYKMSFILAFTLQNGKTPNEDEFDEFMNSKQMWPGGKPCSVYERAFRDIIGEVLCFTISQELG